LIHWSGTTEVNDFSVALASDALTVTACDDAFLSPPTEIRGRLQLRWADAPRSIEHTRALAIAVVVRELSKFVVIGSGPRMSRTSPLRTAVSS